MRTRPAHAEVTIVSPRKARTAPPPQGRWVYLGKDVTSRRQVESAWGRARHPLPRPLSAIVAELRQPFLDFVAEVGAGQSDVLAWWATTFSWKVWGASDLFLLICYLKAAVEVIDVANAEAVRITLVVEDRWLARELAVAYPQARILHHAIWTAQIAAVVLGAARRASWLGRILWVLVRQRRAWGRDCQTGRPVSAAVYTYPMARCMRPELGYDDGWLPGMADILREAGHEVRFFSSPERGGFEAALAERRASHRPLILEATLRSLYLSLFAVWRPSRKGWPRIAFLRVDELARREFWVDASRAAWCRYRFFFETARRYFRRETPEWVVFPFENQPWEKLLVIAARESGARSAGVQHSTLGPNYLSYFWGRGDGDQMPLPDVVLTAGVFPDEVLRQTGYPADRLIMAGSLRYGDKIGEAVRVSSTMPSAARILVALPIDRPMCEHLIAALGDAFPDGGTGDGVVFVVKAHPMTPIDPAALGLKATVASGSFAEALRDCGTVVYVGSTTGPEAAAQGRTVVRYECGLLVDVDVSGPLGNEFPVCRDETIRECLLTAVRTGVTQPVPAAAVRQLFGAVDRSLLHTVFARG